MPEQVEIVIIDGMPCIVLDDCKPIRGAWAPPIPTDGSDEYPQKDFTQLQRENEQKHIKEILEEIKTYGRIFY